VYNGAVVPLVAPWYHIEKQVRSKVTDMKTLSNEALLDSYYKAIDLKLDREFVTLLLAEIKRRKLNIKYFEAQAN
jgi:developmental checkpoint coupling sporulation initiation to replication initiation